MAKGQLCFICPPKIRQKVKDEQKRLGLNSEGEVMRWIVLKYFEYQARVFEPTEEFH